MSNSPEIHLYPRRRSNSHHIFVGAVGGESIFPRSLLYNRPLLITLRTQYL